jgi:UDP-N-acetylmuramoyl-L-alanyl-D-glutamate--2,6-diaminopimelate ligase
MKIEMPSIYPVTSHSGRAGKGSTFVAITGMQENGERYILEALERGASTIVVQQDSVVDEVVLQKIQECRASLRYVQNTRVALSQLAAESLDNPAEKMKIVGVTGTKGKTSTCFMIYQLLMKAGKKVALLSTVEKRIGESLVDLALTTPLPDHLHMFLKMCVDREVEYVVMEVSAQSLSLHRLDNIMFDAGAFTNFSLEHLEFYKNLDEYFESKTLLIGKVKNPAAVFVNIDDQYGRKIAERYPAISTYSLQDNTATMFGTPQYKNNQLDLSFFFQDQYYTFSSHLMGEFNAYNMLAAISIVSALSIPLEVISQGLMALEKIPGRMEKYLLSNGASCFIDYAHNPSSFEAVLSTLRSQTKDLIVVFGAGGGRDKSKRPMMGAIVEKYADLAILTSDNPRDEHPVAIINDIKSGITGDRLKMIEEVNRTTAIEMACTMSQAGSIVAVLGKGRDEYQIVGSLTFPFKERSIIKPFL